MSYLVLIYDVEAETAALAGICDLIPTLLMQDGDVFQPFCDEEEKVMDS